MHIRFLLHRGALSGVLLILLTACELVAAPPSDPNPSAPVEATAVGVLPTAVPTPRSAPDLFASAMNQRAIGNDAAAAEDISTLLATYPSAAEGRPARYYLAESYARRGRWTSAVETLRTLLAEPVEDELLAPALFWLARGYEAAGDWSNAVATYERYRALQTPLEPYAAMRQAAQQQALGQFAEAAANYAYAATTDIVRGERAGSYEKAIALYRQLGQREQALQLYQDLLNFAEQPGYRARILSEAAALAQELGQPEQARAWLLEIIAAAPATTQAVAAVDQLRAANDSGLSASDAARVYFNAERYADALPLFEAGLAQASGDSALELQRLRGLALRGLGRFPEALEALAAVGAAAPDSEPGRQAQLDWIQTTGQSGDVPRAIEGYRQFAAAYPDDPRAPEALNRAIQWLERQGDVEGSVQARLDLGQRYPQSDQAAVALHSAGLFLFQNGRFAEAQAAWQQLADTRSGYERARGAFWAGRAARQQGDGGRAGELFAMARSAAPDSYYGVRAAEELGEASQAYLALNSAISAEQWAELEEWVASWTQVTRRVAEQGYDPAVQQSGFVQRSIALAQVGLHTEAMAEWNSARAAWHNDASSLLQLARLSHEQNVPYIALKSAERLLALAPGTAPAAPIALRRLLFPVPYAELVIAQSREQGVDPRLLLALIRQESLFNPGATSWVGARGLAQVMPSTGEGIAQRLGVTDFTLDDLYRPAVSVRFGAFYIGQRIQDMQGSIQGGLSAYNGGLGNAQRWAGGNVVADPDLFTEQIDFPETENYVKLVYGYYGAYRGLYELP